MSSDPPVIDQARLDLICMGDAALCRELIASLIDEASPIIDELPELVDAKNAVAVRQQAHTLKGIAGNVGAGRLQAAALLLERGAADGAPWDQLAQHLAAATAALTEVKAEHAQTS
jgi:HPt (histidine-containing phosphotransfer) domain-containing protein